eukprot:5495127-Alexandrium_andersonii.AAC.1
MAVLEHHLWHVPTNMQTYPWAFVNNCLYASPASSGSRGCVALPWDYTDGACTGLTPPALRAGLSGLACNGDPTSSR